jgi:hypothetical protein
MDGFYVARIQKLSDKIKTPSDSKDVTTQEVAVDDTDFTEKVEAEKKKQGKGDLKNKAKKRKTGGKDTTEEDRHSAKKVKRDKVSVPPVKKVSKKQEKRSAKMTKPRRMKVE